MAKPVSLAVAGGWTGTQTLMVLAALLTIVLVLAPGVTARVLARRRAE